VDEELFSLCVEVHARTGWGDESLEWWLSNERRAHTVMLGAYPLYTSDYLLEELPPSVYEGDNWVAVHNAIGFDDSPIWSAEYTDGDEKAANDKFDRRLIKLVGSDDTPLKALLKLTIALHDAGELK